MKKLALVLILFLILPPISGCKKPPKEPPQEVINTYEYSDASFTDNNYYEAKHTKTPLADFYYHIGLSEYDMNRFTTYSEQLLDALDGYNYLNHLNTDKLKICVAAGLYTRADSKNNTVYFTVGETKTPNHINYILQAATSDDMSYGLLYGVTHKISKDLGWGGLSVRPDEGIKDALTQQKYRHVLDLNYAVFYEQLTGSLEIGYARDISVKLVKFITDNYGFNAINALFSAGKSKDLAFETLFNGYLNEWLASLSYPVDSVALPKTLIRATSNNSDYPIMISSDSCEYYIHKDWKETYYNTNYWMLDDPFVFSYQSVRDFFVAAEPSYKKTRELINYTKKDKVKVNLKNMPTAGSFSLLNADNGGYDTDSLLGLMTCYPLVLNYNGSFTDSWTVSAIASFCSVAYNPATNKQMLRQARDNIDKFPGNTQQKENYLLGINMYFEYFEEDYSYGESFYSFFVCQLYINLFLNKVEMDFSDPYAFGRYYGAGLVGYLIETYGKDKLLSCHRDGGSFEVFYKTDAEMLQEYRDYLYSLFR